MGNEQSASLVAESVAPETLTARTLPAVAELIKSGGAERIVVMTGAGISTTAGIPDFRSPKTGLYANLRRLDLPYPEAVFDISYFRQHPEPFYYLAKELYPGNFSPTISHFFITLLEKKRLLSMLFTQNIDCLERAAGVSPSKIVEAHGSFATQRCIDCRAGFPDDLMRETVERGEVPRCRECPSAGLVKPDIVFFGEPLPSRFNRESHWASQADLVLIIGTSLSVYPFGALPEMADAGVPRVLFNRERVGQLGKRADDVLSLGPCDAGVRALAEELGWLEELEEMWRAAVGEEEAARQLRRQGPDNAQMQAEMEELGEHLEAALNLEDQVSESESESGGNGDGEGTGASLHRSILQARLDEHLRSKGAACVDGDDGGDSGGGGGGGGDADANVDDADVHGDGEGDSKAEKGAVQGESQVAGQRGSDLGGKEVVYVSGEEEEEEGDVLRPREDTKDDKDEKDEGTARTEEHETTDKELSGQSGQGSNEGKEEEGLAVHDAAS